MIVPKRRDAPASSMRLISYGCVLSLCAFNLAEMVWKVDGNVPCWVSLHGLKNALLVVEILCSSDVVVGLVPSPLAILSNMWKSHRFTDVFQNGLKDSFSPVLMTWLIGKEVDHVMKFIFLTI